MTREFEAKVNLYGTYDTRKYRYRVMLGVCGDLQIVRIPLELLDTTEALKRWNWEVMKSYGGFCHFVDENGNDDTEIVFSEEWGRR